MSDSPADTGAPLTATGEPVPVVADSAAPESADKVPEANVQDASSNAAEKTEEVSAPAPETEKKRPAEAEPEKEVEAKKPKTDAPATAEKEDEDEDVSGELAHLDQGNIIEGGRRTRGRRVDYAALSKENEPEEDEDDEEDADIDPSKLPAEGEEGAEGESEGEGEDSHSPNVNKKF
ncbi:hypothetical protein JCM11641_006961 [Rhodosporidiobolus odoratus]